MSAVLDATLELLAEGAVPPTAEAIAGRSGVSLRSLFRYWSGMHALLTAASERYLADNADVLTYHVQPDDPRPLAERIDAFVDHWCRFFVTVGPMARVVVDLAVTEPYFRALDQASRRTTVDAIEVQFERELVAMSPAGHRRAVADIHGSVILETWETVVGLHHLTVEDARSIAVSRIRRALGLPADERG